MKLGQLFIHTQLHMRAVKCRGMHLDGFLLNLKFLKPLLILLMFPLLFSASTLLVWQQEWYPACKTSDAAVDRYFTSVPREPSSS